MLMYAREHVCVSEITRVFECVEPEVILRCYFSVAI